MATKRIETAQPLGCLNSLTEDARKGAELWAEGPSAPPCVENPLQTAFDESVEEVEEIVGIDIPVGNAIRRIVGIARAGKIRQRVTSGKQIQIREEVVGVNVAVAGHVGQTGDIEQLDEFIHAEGDGSDLSP